MTLSESFVHKIQVWFIWLGAATIRNIFMTQYPK